MDKRWISILIIIIIACVCGYMVVSSSNTVGSAITDISKSTVTLPHGFSVKDSDSESVTLINKNSNEEIYIKDLGKTDIALNKFNSQLKSLSDNKNLNIIENTSNVTDEYKLYNIYYSNSSDNLSISYIYKYDHTYLIKTTGFSDMDDMTDKINFVSDTLKPDYKKSQD